jgi:HAD superfamily hydrolase (TIGR01493 family)
VSPIRGYVFDAYGTLFDVHSVIEAGRAITDDPATLSVAWRQKQLEYTWLRALMGAYVDFWAVTEAALRHTLRRLGLTPSAAQVRRLMDAYLSLACFPEVPAALERLAGRPRAVLSNGSPAMLAVPGRSGSRPASCSSCPRTAGMSPARRRSATRSRGATGPTRPRRSWACAPTSSCARSISSRADAGRRKQHGRLAEASRP